jgi:hypothetical protein
LLFWTGQKRDNVLSRSPATGASTASVFGSDSLDSSREPGLYTGAGLGFPERFRASGPRHTWEYVQAQGKAQEVPRLGISSVGPTLLNPAWKGYHMFPLDNPQWQNVILSKCGCPKRR